jgi:topoisomerase-4 subunit A
VQLQKYKDAKLADVKAFNKAEGLTWTQGKDRTRTETDITTWLSMRATQGKMVPQGFPRDGKFN